MKKLQNQIKSLKRLEKFNKKLLEVSQGRFISLAELSFITREINRIENKFDSESSLFGIPVENFDSMKDSVRSVLNKNSVKSSNKVQKEILGLLDTDSKDSEPSEYMEYTGFTFEDGKLYINDLETFLNGTGSQNILKNTRKLEIVDYVYDISDSLKELFSKDLQNIEKITLRVVSFDDSCIDQFINSNCFKNLKSLHFYGSMMSKKGVERLIEKLPPEIIDLALDLLMSEKAYDLLLNLLNDRKDRLRELSIKDNYLDDRILERISSVKFSSLKSFALVSYEVSYKGLKKLLSSDWAIGLKELSLGLDEVEKEFTGTLFNTEFRNLENLEFVSSMPFSDLVEISEKYKFDVNNMYFGYFEDYEIWKS